MADPPRAGLGGSAYDLDIVERAKDVIQLIGELAESEFRGPVEQGGLRGRLDRDAHPVAAGLPRGGAGFGDRDVAQDVEVAGHLINQAAEVVRRAVGLDNVFSPALDALHPELGHGRCRSFRRCPATSGPPAPPTRPSVAAPARGATNAGNSGRRTGGARDRS